MSYQVLARKWRPKTFAELVGQGHVVQALGNALEQQRLHHAYLFTGTRGVGKTTLARILAKSLNCENGITALPCGQCQPCREIDSGRFVDLLELDAASNTGIDNMREVLDNAQYAPSSGRFKVYIIDEVHMLSKAAFNSMLKTLEEPPQHVKFVLATTDPQKIPVTVLSRCLQFNLKQLPVPLISEHLGRVLEREKIEFQLPALRLLARAAQGSMRDALSLLDQAIAYGGGRVEEGGVRTMLGAIDQSYLFGLLEALAADDGAGMLAIAEEMAGRSLSFDAALQDVGALLHQIALAQTVPEALAEDQPERERIMALARAFQPQAVQLYYQIALLGRKDMGLAPDEYAGFSMTLLRMLAFAPETGAASGDAGPASGKPPVEARPAQRVPGPPAPAGTGAQPAGADNAISFDGDWPALVERLRLGGMARMLAQHCELKAYHGGILKLLVPEAHKHLLEKAYQERLKAAIGEYMDGALKISFSVGTTRGMTPAELGQREKQAKQGQAIAAIEQDPFVRELVENFDARVVESSIKPMH